jgi:hypothetical protein
VRYRTILLAFVAGLSTLPAWSDQVTLANGDVITGAVVKKDGAKLTFKSEVFGEVTIPWASVKSLAATEDLTVVLPGGETVRGPVRTAGDALEVTSPSGLRTAPLAEVSSLRNPAEQQTWESLQNPRLTQLWTGFFDIGLALARGNARTDTLTTSATASRVTRNDKVSVYFSQIRGTARVNGVSSTIANAIRGGWSYNRNITPRIFVSALNDWDHDSFLDLDVRFVLGGGVGVNAIKTETTTLSFLGSADYSRENWSGGVSRDSAEANFGQDLALKLSTVTSVNESFRLFPNLSETGEYRMTFDLGAVTALSKWLGWQVTASDRFLSNPLFGRQRNDLLLSTGLRVTFAK